VKPAANQRIIPVGDLPSTIWDADTLHLAPLLSTAYVDHLRHLGLIELARSRQPDESPVGGLTQAASHDHFAKAFDGSALRAQLALTDPRMHLGEIPDCLALSCAGGTLTLLDLPSGAGAFSLALLCTIAELREKRALPRQPLEVVVVGGELSQHATDLATALYLAIAPKLEEQAIFAQFKALSWDACDDLSTTRLMQRFVADADKSERKLVALSNFNGFLVREKKQTEAQPQIEQIFRYSSGDGWCTGIWVEPQMNAAKKNLWPWVGKMLGRVQAWLSFGESIEPRRVPETEIVARLPCQPERNVAVRLSVMKYDLGSKR
jgi:hypothetical protein